GLEPITSAEISPPFHPPEGDFLFPSRFHHGLTPISEVLHLWGCRMWDIKFANSEHLSKKPIEFQ
ncbi:MAG: hypothetical protein QNJ41_27775, partial [Xenococcaceae cyanobacterium MO_188.B32]|nr:hypothetical protein [Xenococcaceae cyanobacterium MO_188.B32]